MPNRRKKSFQNHRARHIKSGKITRISKNEKRAGLEKEI